MIPLLHDLLHIRQLSIGTRQLCHSADDVQLPSEKQSLLGYPVADMVQTIQIKFSKNKTTLMIQYYVDTGNTIYY